MPTEASRTRAYCIVQLLRFESMSLDHIVRVGGAGWDRDGTARTLKWLRQAGVVTSTYRDGTFFHLPASFDEALRRLRACEQRAGAPAGMAPLQPSVPDVRSEVHLLRAPVDIVVSGATRRAHDPDRRGMGRAWARRAAAARGRRADVGAVVGVGP